MKSNFRHLRSFLAVIDTGSITKAAELSHVSQPAVTQSIRKLEAHYGVTLFERTPRGLFPTAAANVLAHRVRRSFLKLNPSLAELAPRLTLTATSSQLTALIAAVDAENFTLAARRLGLAQPTVHRAIAELENEAGRTLFERTSRGMIASRSATSLARAAQLAFSELDQADADMGELAGREVGSISIGAMPLSRASILPQAIAGFRRRWPTLPVKAIDGPYGDLLDALRRGQLDFLIGALRDPAPMEDVEQEKLFDDKLVVVCGTQHEIRAIKGVDLNHLAKFPWVVAPKGTPARHMFDRVFQGKVSPESLVETSSAILMRELLSISNHLGFISSVQVKSDLQVGSIYHLPLELLDTSRPIGVSMRSGWVPTKAQSDFLDEVRRASAHFADFSPIHIENHRKGAL